VATKLLLTGLVFAMIGYALIRKTPIGTTSLLVIIPNLVFFVGGSFAALVGVLWAIWSM